jgi:hypothetical protein
LELFTDEDYLEFCENVMKEKGIKWVSQEWQQVMVIAI